tara:strand:+ start:11907 stop:13382 length:1476 start_codon:yes stop_codon:yes gene_type:complete
MSEYNVNQGLVEEAKSILNGLRAHQKNAEDRLSNMDRQIEDLKLSQRKLSEAYTKAAPEYRAQDETLRRYVRKDGTLRLKAEKKQIQIGGQGAMTSTVPGLLDETEPTNEWHAKLLKINKERNFARMLMANPHTPKMDLKLYKHLEVAPRCIKPGLEKAYDGTSGKGSQWTQAQFVDSLYESYTVPRRLRSLLPTVECDRGSLIIPTLTKGAQPYVQGTAGDDINLSAYPASTVTTGQTVISLAGMTVRCVVDQVAAEDSALALASVLSRNIGESIESGFEDCMINGQTGIVGSFDTGLASWTGPDGRWTAGSSSDHRLTFDGWRKLAFDASTQNTPNDGADVLFSDIVSCISKMGEFGAAERLMVVSPSFLIKNLLDMSELATIDKFGPQATVLTGQVGALLGMPVIMSRFMTDDLNANGKYDNITKDYTGYLIYNRSSYVQYLRRGLQIESQRNIASGAFEIVASLRAVMGSADAAASKNVAFQYAIDK